MKDTQRSVEIYEGMAPKPEPRQCYRNAALVALKHGLIYVEGWIIFSVGGTSIPTEHGWNVDEEEGNIIDVTAVRVAGELYDHYFPVSQFLPDDITAGILPYTDYRKMNQALVDVVVPFMNK